MRKFTIVTIILDILVAICFFVFYGPFESFRNNIISTALSTKTHGYIAYVFYSEDQVAKVSQANSYIPFTESVNTDDVVINTQPKTSYDNEYDEAVLTRDAGNNDYKLIDIKVGSYDAHLVAIYNPTKVHLITSKVFNTSNNAGSETITKMCKRVGGTVCINGGGFADPDGWGSDIPMGYLIKDGKIIWSENDNKADLIGFTKEGKLLLINATGEEAIKQGMYEALQFGPFLMVNGKRLQFNSSAGGYSRAARVAIAQRKDGVVLFLVTEGVHSKGPSLTEVIDTLEKYGAYNAANLDGGTSAQLVINNKLINTPLNVYGQVITGGRACVSGFALIK